YLSPCELPSSLCLISICISRLLLSSLSFLLFFFNDPSTTDIYTLSLHDALPISSVFAVIVLLPYGFLLEYNKKMLVVVLAIVLLDRKSTRLNSSHVSISYAVFCLKKKKNK